MTVLRRAGFGILWFALVCAAGRLSAESATWRIGSFNLANYLVTDRVVEGIYRFDYPKPEAEKAALRAALLKAQVDVLAVQEIGDQSYVWELQRDLRRVGLDYPHVAWLDGPDEARHLAIFSRFPFSEAVPHAEVTFGYFGERVPVKRGMLEVAFEMPSGEVWHLFNIHLKSRYTTRPEDPGSEERRVGEAQALRDLLRERLATDAGEDRLAPALLVGDFNDTRGSRALRRFLEVGGRTLFEAIDCADSRGERWTHYYGREDVYSRVDYILCTPSLRPAMVPGSEKILDAEAFLPASDHRLLWVDVKIASETSKL